MAAVYGNSHPEYAKYLYVMAPISLVVLNPLGFLCLEIADRRKANQRHSNAALPGAGAANAANAAAAAAAAVDGTKDPRTVSLTNKNRTQRANNFKVFFFFFYSIRHCDQKKNHELFSLVTLVPIAMSYLNLISIFF